MKKLKKKKFFTRVPYDMEGSIDHVQLKEDIIIPRNSVFSSAHGTVRFELGAYATVVELKGLKGYFICPATEDLFDEIED